MADLCLAIEYAYGPVIAVPCNDASYKALIESTKPVIQESAGGASGPGGGAVHIPLFELTTVEGSQIAGAILLVWATGWAFRMAVRALSTGDDKPDAD